MKVRISESLVVWVHRWDLLLEYRNWRIHFYMSIPKERLLEMKRRWSVNFGWRNGGNMFRILKGKERITLQAEGISGGIDVSLTLTEEEFEKLVELAKEVGNEKAGAEGAV